MNAIQKAVAILRNIKGSPAECAQSWFVADELEALLGQEPVAWVFDKPTHFGGYVGCISIEMPSPVGNVHINPLYTDPRPPCDLKSLAEDVRDACVKTFKTSQVLEIEYDMNHIDLDAIIAKHTGGK